MEGFTVIPLKFWFPLLLTLLEEEFNLTTPFPLVWTSTAASEFPLPRLPPMIMSPFTEARVNERALEPPAAAESMVPRNWIDPEPKVLAFKD